MSAVLFSAHSDDAVLFACYSVLAHECHVVNVLRSQVQEDRGTGITQAHRHREDVEAMSTLGVGVFEQWPENDRDPDWLAIERMMTELRDQQSPTLVFAPAVEVGGHEQHNAIGNLVHAVFAAHTSVYDYLTYVRGNGRSTSGTLVEPEPWMISLKLQALACYQSQIGEQSTRPWFYDQLDMREWIS